MPARRHAAVRLPVPRAVRHRRRRQARPGAPRRRSIPRSRGTLDLVALATIADVVPLVDENRALADAGPARARAHAEARAPRADARRRGVDPATVDATAVAFRLAPRINAAGRLGRPDVGLISCSPTTRARPTCSPNELETLNRDRQAVEERILREAVARRRGAGRRQKRSRRAYVVWGEGWHEGVIGIVASRLVERFGRPVVLIAGEGDALEGLGAVGPELRPARGPRRLRRRTSSASAATAPPPACRSGRTSSRRSPPRSPPTPTPSSPTRTCAPVTPDRRDRARRRAHARPRPGARAARAVRARQPRRDAARRGRARRSAPRRSARASTCASASASTGGTPAARSPSASAAQLERLQGGARFDVAFRLKENRWNGTVAPQLVVRRVFDAAGGLRGAACLAREPLAGGRDGVDAGGAADLRRARARASAAGKRQLLESPTFRALLEHGAPAQRCRRPAPRGASGRRRARRARWSQRQASSRRGRVRRARTLGQAAGARAPALDVSARLAPMARSFGSAGARRSCHSKGREYTETMAVVDAERHHERPRQRADRERRGLQPRRRQGADPPRLRRAPSAPTAGQVRRSGEEFINHPLGRGPDLRAAAPRRADDRRGAAARRRRGHRDRARRAARRVRARHRAARRGRDQADPDPASRAASRRRPRTTAR